MIIAITYEKETNRVFQHFGRTENFYLYDTDTKEGKVVDNGGFGHADLVGYLSDLDVSVLICGGLGSHAIQFLAQAGIKVIPGIDGEVEDVIKAYLDGTLDGDPHAVHECSHHHDEH